MLEARHPLNGRLVADASLVVSPPTAEVQSSWCATQQRVCAVHAMSVEHHQLIEAIPGSNALQTVKPEGGSVVGLRLARVVVVEEVRFCCLK